MTGWLRRQWRRDVLVISHALGHSNVGTTQRYIEHLYPDEVLKAMLDSEWGHAGPAAHL